MPNIMPISDLRNYSDVLHSVTPDSPVFLTKNGRGRYAILDIDEYDVLASHSAAVGKVNDEHMYYLCSRCLSEEVAREFITMGYLLPVLNYFVDEDIKKKAQMTLERRVVNG